MSSHPSTDTLDTTDSDGTDSPPVEYLVVGEMRTEDDADTCLRPLGLCELGGCCDSCWYRPDHPRFRNR
jgi:hypothetical protein